MPSISRNTSCLTPVSSKTASMTKSASANSCLSTVPVTRERRRFAVSPSTRPLDSSFAISSPIDARPLSTRDWSTSVMTTGTCRRRTKRSANWLAISPAPMTPTFVTRRARSLSGAATGRFARFWTRSNAYIDAANWSPTMSSDRASSSRAKPSSAVPMRAASSRSSARYGDAGTVPIRRSSVLRAILIAAGHLTVRSIRPGACGRSTVIDPSSTRSAQASESSR